MTMLDSILMLTTFVLQARSVSYSSYSFGDSLHWNYFYTANYYSYISDGISVPTTIAVHQSASGYLYGLVVNGITSGTSTDGLSLYPCPDYSTGSTLF